MSKIPTAREFYDKHHSDDAVVMMKDFAKLHVEAALKEASETKVEGHFGSGKYNRDVADKDSILTSYPLTNII